MFRPRTPPEAIDLVSKLLEYTPAARLHPMEACAHPFFNELRLPDAKMPSGQAFPPLFNFTHQGQNFVLNLSHNCSAVIPKPLVHCAVV